MAKSKVTVGDVIRLNYRKLGENSYFTRFGCLFKHQYWVVMRVYRQHYLELPLEVIRIRPLDKSHILMTPWICLELPLGEYTHEPFLTAAYKATRNVK